MSSADRRPRFVVLGASNVSLSIATIVSLARGAHPEPLEVIAAHGRGRSFEGWSRAFFVRDLPGIGECDLWRALESRTASTSALVCDVGNDLVYGATPQRIAECVSRDVGRLQRASARTVLVRMPMDSLRTLGKTRFQVIQRIIFPGRKQMELAAMLDSAAELDRRMESIARDHGATLATLRKEWYGFDPIHILRSDRPAAWAEILAPLWPSVKPMPWSTADRRALRRSRPQVRKLFGREQRAGQPSARFSDGSTLAWY